MRGRIEITGVEMIGDMPIAIVSDETGLAVGRLAPTNFYKGLQDRYCTEDIKFAATQALERFGEALNCNFEPTGELNRFALSVANALNV